MNKEMLNKKMPEITDAQSCARASDLVAYLYGEASAGEAHDFRSHLDTCTGCRAELAAFSEVREAVGEWREQALHPMTSTATEANAARVQRPVAALPKRSALAALREFFTLSPIWLRGATAFAALLLVALLVVTVIHFSEKKDSPIANQTTPTTPAAAPERKPETVIPKEQLAVTPSGNQQPVKSVEVNKHVMSPKNNIKTSRNTLAASKQRRQPEGQELTNDESLQLREILVAREESEDNIPRLSDLLHDSN